MLVVCNMLYTVCVNTHTCTTEPYALTSARGYGENVIKMVAASSNQYIEVLTNGHLIRRAWLTLEFC